MIIGSKKTVEKVSVKQHKPDKKDKQINSEPKDDVIISGDSEDKKPEKIYLEIKSRDPVGSPWINYGKSLKTRHYRVRNIEKQGDDNYNIKILTDSSVTYNHDARESGTWLRTKDGWPISAEDAVVRMKINFDKPEENPTPQAVIPEKASPEELSKRVYLKIKARGSVYAHRGNMVPYMTRHYRVRNIERKDDETFSVTVGKDQKFDYNHEAMEEGTWLETYSGKPLLAQEAAKIMGIDI